MGRTKENLDGISSAVLEMQKDRKSKVTKTKKSSQETKNMILWEYKQKSTSMNTSDIKCDSNEHAHLTRSKSDTETEFKRRVIWRSCCVELDRRAVLYFSQLTISVVLIVFCVTMLVVHQDCNTFSRYSPLVTLIVGVWLPQPQLRES